MTGARSLLIKNLLLGKKRTHSSTLLDDGLLPFIAMSPGSSTALLRKLVHLYPTRVGINPKIFKDSFLLKNILKELSAKEISTIKDPASAWGKVFWYLKSNEDSLPSWARKELRLLEKKAFHEEEEKLPTKFLI